MPEPTHDTLRSIRAAEGWPETPVYPQCSSCIRYLPLSGRLGADWGVCGNPSANVAGRLRFEHDGCAEYDPCYPDPA
jgi:hypothetical protein